jgi:hypothetical protein
MIHVDRLLVDVPTHILCYDSEFDRLLAKHSTAQKLAFQWSLTFTAMAVARVA